MNPNIQAKKDKSGLGLKVKARLTHDLIKLSAWCALHGNLVASISSRHFHLVKLILGENVQT